MLVRSPFLTFADRDFISAGGHSVRPVFRASDAKVLLVPSALAKALVADQTGQLAEREREALVDAGLLVHDVQAHMAEVMAALAQGNEPLGKRTFVLLPTSYCNMGCDYCGQAHQKSSLAGQHRTTIVDRVLRAAHDPGTREVHVAWFGGEPLMAFATVRQMSKQILAGLPGSDLAYTSKMTTNGALLDHRKLRSLVHDCAVTRFDITIDGLPEVHDDHRPLKNGRPSGERLIDFLADATGRDEFSHVTFVLRTNVDSTNASGIDGYLDHMGKRGFGGRANVFFQLAPIHSWGNDITDKQIAWGDLGALEIAWFERMLQLRLRCSPLPTATVGNVCVATTRRSEVVSADGKVFSCTEHPLVPQEHQVSAVSNLDLLPVGQLRPLGRYDGWVDNLPGADAPCPSCALLPVCGGSCPKLWLEGKVACPSMKSNMPQRLSLTARAQGLQPAGSSADR